MYVCICKGITESELAELAASHAHGQEFAKDAMIEHASATLGIGTGCGRCVEFAADLLEESAGLQTGQAA